MVLKGVNWVHNAKIRLYGLERSQLGIQWEKKIFTLWILSLNWKLINNFLVLNSKTIQKQQNPQFLAKLQVWFSSKPQSLEENSQFLVKICDFHQKLWISEENLQFLSKSAVFSWEIRQYPRILFCKVMRFRPLIK